MYSLSADEAPNCFKAGYEAAVPGHRNLPRELRVAAQSLVRVAWDTRRQQDLFNVFRNFPVFDIMKITTLRLKILQDPAFLEMYRRCDLPDFTAAGIERLRRLPVGTLGRGLADFVQGRNLDDKFLGYLLPPDNPIRYLVYRTAILHDLVHYVTEYKPDDVYGEIEVDAFQLVQTGAANHTMFMGGGLANVALNWPTRLPHALARAELAAERGRRSRTLFLVEWQARLERPVADVREELGLTPFQGISPW